MSHLASVRLGGAFLAALTLTSAMFWFLHALISVHVDPAALKAAARIEFTRLRRDSDVQSRREVKPKLELAPRVPSAPMVAAAGAVTGGGAAVAPLAASPGRLMGAGPMVAVQKIAVKTGGSDRDVMPLVRIEPEYPMRALQSRVQGWVLVRFNITSIGTVRDVVVVDSVPKGIFDDAAVRAVSRWKYNPKIEDGIAVERRGMEVYLYFTLDKGKSK